MYSGIGQTICSVISLPFRESALFEKSYTPFSPLFKINHSFSWINCQALLFMGKMEAMLPFK